MQPEAQLSHVCFLAVSAGDLKVAIVTKALEKFLLHLHLHLHLTNFLLKTNLCLMNEEDSTYVHPATGSCSSLDLAICDPLFTLISRAKLTIVYVGAITFPYPHETHRTPPQTAFNIGNIGSWQKRTGARYVPMPWKHKLRRSGRQLLTYCLNQLRM